MPIGLRTFRPRRLSRRYVRQTRKRYDKNRDPKVKKWQNSRMWVKVLRPGTLKAAGYVCVICARQGLETEANVADHIEPHLGDYDKFHDPENLQALCKSCHDRKTVQYDGGFGRKRKKYVNPDKG